MWGCLHAIIKGASCSIKAGVRARPVAPRRRLAWAELVAKLVSRKARAAVAVDAREEERRRTRQKSRGQKVRMIQAKKHRAGIKACRGRPGAN